MTSFNTYMIPSWRKRLLKYIQISNYTNTKLNQSGTSVPSFRSINRLSKWLVSWSIAAIIIAVIFLTLQCYVILQYVFYNSIDTTTFVIDSVVASISGVISFIVTIIMLIWFYRANKNIHAFGAKEISSPRMAVIWWFIPILQLWKPYSIAQQIWKVSNPQLSISNGTEWKKLAGSRIIKLWWVLGLIYTAVAVIGTIFMMIAVGLDNYLNPEQATQGTVELTVFYSNIIGISSNILAILSTLFFIRMIKQVSAWQEIKSGISI